MADRKAATPRPRVLVVDDQFSMAEMVSDGLSERGYDAVPLASSREAAKRLADESFDALVTDLRMPELDGIELLAHARKIAPTCPVIVMTAYSAVDTAVHAIRQGAYHYLTKPFKVDELALFLGRALDETRVRKEARTLRKALDEQTGISTILGQSGAMRDVCDLVMRVADAAVPVLVLGETGTGKGLVARAIHAHGVRAAAPFVSVNCAALPENLLESELFGHVKGAFTGASSNRVGLFREADGGTLFLDEVGEMSPALQAKLLLVLESGTVRPVGASKDHPVDTRVVAATHRNLRARVAEGSFREDLLYRLDVVTIEIPPLRHRTEDIPLLFEHFLRASKAKHERSPAARLSPEALDRIMNHAWPGNVREIEHVVERLVLLGRSEEIAASDLPPTLAASAKESGPLFRGDVLPMRELQRRYAVWALETLGARKMLTAEKLGVDIKTLGRWLHDDTRDVRDAREVRDVPGDDEPT
jgi:two-component system response regulator HydG